MVITKDSYFFLDVVRIRPEKERPFQRSGVGGYYLRPEIHIVSIDCDYGA